MASITYSVAVEYHSTGRIDPGFANAERNANAFTKKFASHMGSAASSFNSAFDSAAAMVVSAAATTAAAVGSALVGGVALGVHEMMRFNEQMENTQISLAAISKATGESSNMFGGLRIAGSVMQQMRKDAAQLPGEFSDLANILTTIMPAARKSGVGTSGGETIAAMTMAAASVLGVQMGTAGREIAAMMEGRAGIRMPMFVKMGFHDAKSFNAMSAADRFKAVREKLEGFKPAVDFHKDSWTGIKNTAIDNVRMGVGATGGDLFERVKDKVKEFNMLAGGQRGAAVLEKMGVLSQKISTSLVRAFDWAFGRAAQQLPGIAGPMTQFGDLFVMIPEKVGVITGLMREWGPHAKNFARTLEIGLKAAFHSQNFSHFKDLVQKFMDDPLAFQKMEKLAKMLVGARVGSGAIAGGAQLVPGMMGLGKAFGTGGALAGSALPVAAGLALLGVSAYGASHALMDGSSQFHNSAVSSAKSIASNMEHLSRQLEQLMTKAEPLTDFMGDNLLTSLRLITGALDLSVTAINFFAEGVGQAYDFIAGFIPGMSTRAEIAAHRASFADDAEFAKSLLKYNEQLMPVKAMNALAEREGKPESPKHTTHIHQVKIEVRSNQDPRRIAKATFDVLQDFARRPSSSPFDPTSQFIRGY